MSKDFHPNICIELHRRIKEAHHLYTPVSRYIQLHPYTQNFLTFSVHLTINNYFTLPPRHRKKIHHAFHLNFSVKNYKNKKLKQSDDSELSQRCNCKNYESNGGFYNTLDHTNFRLLYGEMKEENALETTADKVVLISEESYNGKTWPEYSLFKLGWSNTSWWWQKKQK